MVDLSDGFDGLIEHGFSNVVFVIPAVIVIGLAGKRIYLKKRGIIHFPEITLFPQHMVYFHYLDRTWNNISLQQSCK